MVKSLLYGLLFWALCNISFKWYTLWRQELEPIFLPNVVELLVYFSAGIFFLHFKWKHSFWFLLPALGVSITLLFTLGNLTGLIHWAFVFTGFNLGKIAYLQWNRFLASSPNGAVSQAG
jgi:hypothetical protein